MPILEFMVQLSWILSFEEKIKQTRRTKVVYYAYLDILSSKKQGMLGKYRK